MNFKLETLASVEYLRVSNLLTNCLKKLLKFHSHRNAKIKLVTFQQEITLKSQNNHQRTKII